MVGAQSLGAGYFPMEDVQPFLGEESSGLGGGVVDPFPLESPPVGNQTDAVGTAAGQSDAGVGNRPA